MKKFFYIITSLIVISSAIFYYANRLDYNKVVLVLPSSNRASSLYFYKKDGDFFLAQDLGLGLEKLGYTVEYRFREDFNNMNLKDAGNIIYFKGYYNFASLPQDNVKKRKKVLYIYYVEGLNENTLKEADVIVSASKKFLNEYILSKGLKGEYAPQFTNPERFKNSTDPIPNPSDVLFVGSNHTGKGRKSVEYAINANANLDVYGKYWNGYIPQSYIKGNYIENNNLSQYYANAKIVLNDHRDDMQHFGFISNRIFDVSASGGFVFTDYLKEIEEIYGDSIAMFKTQEEFTQKLQYYLANEDVRKEMSKKAQKITLENFTNLKIAQKFSDILKNIKK